MTRPTDASLKKASEFLAEIKHEFRHGTTFKWAIARLLDESSQRHVVDHLIPYVGARADQEARAIQADAALTTEREKLAGLVGALELAAPYVKLQADTTQLEDDDGAYAAVIAAIAAAKET